MSTTQAIYQAPDLSDEQFLGAVCGLRPCRKGGLRLEIDHTGEKPVVHNYGHGGCGVTLSMGCAQIVGELVDSLQPNTKSAAVIGAGVVGITSAIKLLRRGFDVNIYAEHSGLETTSAIAGALWLPVGIDFGDTPEKIQWMHRLLLRSKSAFGTLDPVRFGIEDVTVYEPVGSETEEYLFNNGSIEPQVEIDSFPFPCQVQASRKFTTRFIHNTRFLTELLAEFDDLGGVLITRRFEDVHEIEALDEAVVINCTGLGAKSLWGDDHMYPARGVLVHMRPQDLGYCVHDGYKYMFPREDALVLGGCFQEDQWSDVPDQIMIDEILNHHRRFFGQS